MTWLTHLDRSPRQIAERGVVTVLVDSAGRILHLRHATAGVVCPRQCVTEGVGLGQKQPGSRRNAGWRGCIRIRVTQHLTISQDGLL